MAEKMEMKSKDWLNENTQFIAERFPNCVTETEDGLKVDFELLQQELSGDVISGSKERYRLEWPGKRQAMVNANLPTTKTLRPVREDSVDFDNTENLYIEGDNLEVLKILQESYLGKIKMIYIDPPYNTGKDFVYKDNFTQDSEEYKEDSGQTDEYNRRLVSNPDTSGRYHSDWLSMMYPRLKLARNLLTEDGVAIFSIDENEVTNLRKLLDEIFGEQNFAGEIIWKNSSKNDQSYVSIQHEYVLIYVKSKSHNEGDWKEEKQGLAEIFQMFERLKQKHGAAWDTIHEEALKFFRQQSPSSEIFKSKHYSWMDDQGVYFPDNISGPNHGQYVYDVIHPVTKEVCKAPSSGWRFPEKTMHDRIAKDMIHFGPDHTTVPNNKTYLENTRFQSIGSVKFKDGRVASKQLQKLFGQKVFTNPKDAEFLSSIFYACGLRNNDVVLDFFSGSGTTAESVMLLNRQKSIACSYVLVQLPESLEEMRKTAVGGSRAVVQNSIDYLNSLQKPLRLTELAKERIRKSESALDLTETSTWGFKVYYVDESNMEDVYYQPQTLDQGNISMFASSIKADRTSEDLLTQVLLDWGLPLTLRTEKATLEGKEVYKVAGDSLYACFDEGLDEAFAKVVAAEKPLRLVVKDSAFASDTAKVNVQQLLKQLSPNTELKVL